jgi:NADH:ubiquinone oxidoreductase subunit 5 (subunit L)/multisubunit Na+/H+ antiporter MnhA subunit
MAPLLDNYYIYIGKTKINLIEISAILFVVGGGVKSAQFGFHI